MHQKEIEVEAAEETDFAASTTTTTPLLAAWENLPNPCKFRGHTLEILEALYDCGALTTREIANITRMNIKDVGKYCRHGKRNCIVVKVDRWKWMITDFGSLVFEINKNNIDKEETNNNQRGNIEETWGNRTSDSPKKQRQLNLSIFEQNEDLNELQREVVVAMAKHYEKTGRPYFMIRDLHQFRDEVGLDSRYGYTDVQDIVISLDAAGLIYQVQKGDILKIGLLKSTIERLRNA